MSGKPVTYVTEIDPALNPAPGPAAGTDQQAPPRAHQGGGCLMDTTRRLAAALFRPLRAVRSCSPGEYAIRFLTGLAPAAAMYAALRWVFPAHGMPGFASCPPAARVAVIALAVLTAWDVALLRVRGWTS